MKYYFLFSLVFCIAKGYAGTTNHINKGGEECGKALSIKNVRMVARVTGDSLPGEKLYQPNRTGDDFDVYGTDLGLMWQIEGRNIGLFFGDTSGKGFIINKNGGNGENWRSNVLAFSTDTNLDDGLKIDSMSSDSEGKAREICAGGKANPKMYQTSIPTSAIHVGKLDCVHYMNIYDWGAPHGRWLTNFSSIYTSADGGHTWISRKEVTFSSESHFSQIAYAKKDGWVYMIGTQAGRGDAAYLARFRESDLLNMQTYEYWNGKKGKWVRGDESAATPILRGPVGEASLIWHKKFKRWILSYNYDPRYDKVPLIKTYGILYCDTENITQWGASKVLVTGDNYPGLYGAYIYPLKDQDDKLWFLMSMWGPYNVFLMSADIIDEDEKCLK